MPVQQLGSALTAFWAWLSPVLTNEHTLLIVVTIFFAFARVYSEISSPSVPFRAFLSVPFALYAALAFPLSFIVYFGLAGDGGFPTAIDVIVAGAAGVLGTNVAGTKVEGFQQLIQGLADRIKERIGIQITQVNIASQADLHAQIVKRVPDQVLEREVTFLGEAPPKEVESLAKRWSMAKTLIKKNPVRAKQLVRMKSKEWERLAGTSKPKDS